MSLTRALRSPSRRDLAAQSVNLTVAASGIGAGLAGLMVNGAGTLDAVAGVAAHRDGTAAMGAQRRAARCGGKGLAAAGVPPGPAARRHRAGLAGGGVEHARDRLRAGFWGRADPVRGGAP